MVLRRTKSQKIAASSPHDVYSVTCSCGEHLTGERDTDPLIIECPQCSEPLYVLPKDLYPRPKVLKPEVEPEDELLEEEDVLELSIEEIEDENQRLAEPKDDTPPRVWVDRPRSAFVRKRIFQVSGVIVVLLLVTWWGVTRRVRRTEAEATFFSQSEAAREFVSKSNWEDARAAADEAVAAADFLDRHDPASEEIRDLSKELDILSKLSSNSLVEIVLEKVEKYPDPATWERKFSVLHSESWLLLEGVIVRQMVDDEPRYSFEYPTGVLDQNVDLVWDEPVAAFEEFDWKDNRFRAFLAVRMRGVRFRQDDPDSWSIILSPDDVRLWTTPELLTEALGVDLDSEETRSLRELVESQIPADRVRRDERKQDRKSAPPPESNTDPLSTGAQQ